MRQAAPARLAIPVRIWAMPRDAQMQLQLGPRRVPDAPAHGHLQWPLALWVPVELADIA